MARSAAERRGEAPGRGNSTSPSRSSNDLGDDIIDGPSTALEVDGGGSLGEEADQSTEGGKQTVHYPDGDVYEGELKDGEPHGRGVYRYADGDVYDGEWRDGRMHGTGTFTATSGNVYEGDFKDGMMHGRGTQRGSDGGTYHGEWKENAYHGKGTLTSPGGDTYEGEFKEDKAHGWGTKTYPNGDVYKGDFEEGAQRGWGSFQFTSGLVYQGEIEDGMPHGKGTMTYPTGHVYEGQWVEGNQNGKGTFKWNNGDIYVGEFKEGNAHGKGTLKFSSGDIYEGLWADGQRESKGTMKWANGDIQTGFFDREGGCKLRSQRSQQRRLQADKKACENCGADDYRYKLRTCSGCSLALYCSIACQRAVSGSHQRICNIASGLPPKDADGLDLAFSKDEHNDFDACLRYATKYMSNLKHLEVDFTKMDKDDAVKLSAKQLSSLLKSEKGVLESISWMQNAVTSVPGITVGGNEVWNELYGLKQLRLRLMLFQEVQCLCEIIDHQRETLISLSLQYLILHWHRAKCRRAIAQAVNSCKHLVNLDLQGSWLTDSDLKVMLADLPNLRILHLWRNPSIEGSREFTDNTCGLIARKCPSLQQLSLNFHNQLSVRGLCKIFEGCVHLRAFYTTTRKLNCNDVQSLLDVAPQLLYLSLADTTDISEDELSQIIEATGGRTVLQLSSGGNFEPDGISAKTREKHECQKDVLSEVFSRRGDPGVANEWKDLFEG